VRPCKPCLDKIENGRLESCRKSLTGDCRTDQRENSRTDDGADADTREIERVERALNLPLGRGRFGHQTLRTLGFEKLRAHRARSSHQAVRVVDDLLNEFLNWDSKFFTTISLLILKPWRLTNEFLAGKRVRYVNPLRLYLLASILFFFAVNYGAKGIRIDPTKFPDEKRAEVA